MRLTTLRLARPAALLPVPRTTRAFTTTSPLALKEDHKSPSPEDAERVKQEQLRKQAEGRGHWHEELASSSEAAVGADQEKVGDKDQHMRELQEEAKRKSEGEKGGK